MADKNEIKNVLDAAIAERVFPGCALAWIKDGALDKLCAGRYTYDDDAPLVTERSIYDCASITKSIPVSCLAMWLVDLGKLSLDDLLIKFVPDYCGSFRERITIKHLLTHTLDFDFRLSEHKDKSAYDLLDAILNVKMKSAPGEKFCYANATSILLGMVVEKVFGKPLHVAAQEIVFDPLDMCDTTFFPSDDVIKNIVPTEIDPWRNREIRGEVHDESAWVLREIMTAGSAGMFSTASDLIKFVKMILDGGTFYDKDAKSADDMTVFFSSDIIEQMHTNQIPHIANNFTGLGWELNQEYMGSKRTTSTIGKTGFTGTCVVIDKTKNVGIVMLTNRTYPTRPTNREAITKVRQQVFDLIF